MYDNAVKNKNSIYIMREQVSDCETKCWK